MFAPDKDRYLVNQEGKETNENNEFLNKQLKNIIKEKGEKNRPTIYIHYSDSEHTYFEHISYLLNDLNNANISVFEDVQHYQQHGDLYKYYPKYLVDTVKKIIEC